MSAIRTDRPRNGAFNKERARVEYANRRLSELREQGVADAAAWETIATELLSVNGKQHRVHRLIWIMLVGEIPDGYQIDHIDGNRANNHISNLRLATRIENQRNSKKRCDNTSGTKGVSFDKHSGKWRVQIKKDGKKNTSVLFEKKDEAIEYVRQSRELLHKDFTNHGV